MASQFVSVEAVPLLSHLGYPFPPGTHVVGRLDALSEGLLILTTNKQLSQLLFRSGMPHKRTYLVRVNNVMTAETVRQLTEGVTISVRGKGQYTTAPCEAQLLPVPPDLPAFQLEQNPRIPHSWLRISLYEGKRHQVRNMVRAVGHPCRRLVRVAIEDLHLAGLPPGHVREVEEADFFHLLKIDHRDLSPRSKQISMTD